MSVNMSFTINATNAVEISRGIRDLAAILDATARESGIATTTTTVEAKPEPAPASTSAQAQAPAPPPWEEPPAPAPAPSVSLETVRAKLTALVQAGKQPEVQALISSYGVNKLSEVPPERYADLLEKAGAIG